MARIQKWHTFSTEQFVLRVDSPDGTTNAVLWENWGPAHRVSLYIAPNERLIALGGGGKAQAFDVSKSKPPQQVDLVYGEDSSGWRYIGVVDYDEQRQLRFFLPSEERECVPMYGAGQSPYRLVYQDQNNC